MTRTTTFASFGVPEDLAAVLAKRGISDAFPIQAATLPDALAGADICGRAPTGSGKTLAFALTIATRTTKARPKHPHALVLVPTRELAAQVARELHPLAGERKLHVATVYGGVGYGDQRSALRKGVDVLVACPGRLEDLMEQQEVFLDRCSIVVVDEADRMADMGFLPAVKRLLDKTPNERQTLLFSATLDGDVDVLVRKYQKNPRKFAVETPEEEQGDVAHFFWRAEREERVRLTTQLIAQNTPTIVFCRTRHGADRLAKQLSAEGIKAAPIHGSRSQGQRERALYDFQAGRVKALVATDVAARGIHVDDVSCVVHFDPPSTHKDYVHRSGRTGRAGADGTVVSFVQRSQTGEVRAIQKALKMPHRIDRPDLSILPTRHVEPKPMKDPMPAAAMERPKARRPQDRSHGRPERKGNPRRRYNGSRNANGNGSSNGSGSSGSSGGSSHGRRRRPQERRGGTARAQSS